jgi:hypothetical protein
MFNSHLFYPIGVKAGKLDFSLESKLVTGVRHPIHNFDKTIFQPPSHMWANVIAPNESVTYKLVALRTNSLAIYLYEYLLT